MTATPWRPTTASAPTTGSSGRRCRRAAGRCWPTTRTWASRMPSIWFINGLHCATVDDACPYDVAGVSFPGVPGVVLGHNARIAWGATNVDPDVQDLVIETIDPADPTRYLAPDGTSQPFAVRTETIEVSRRGSRSRWRSARPPTARSSTTSTRGSPTRPRWPCAGPGIHPSGRARTGPSTRSSPSNVAGDYDAFRAALSTYVAPVPELRLRRRRRPHRLPAARPRAGPLRPVGPRPPPGPRRRRHAASGPGSSRTTTCPASSTPATAGSSRPTTPRSTRRGPTSSAPSGIPGYRAERIIDLIDAAGGRPDPRRDERHPDRHARRCAPATSSSCTSTGSPPATADGAAVADADRRLGRRRARSTASAARPT